MLSAGLLTDCSPKLKGFGKINKIREESWVMIITSSLMFILLSMQVLVVEQIGAVTASRNKTRKKTAYVSRGTPLETIYTRVRVYLRIIVFEK